MARTTCSTFRLPSSKSALRPRLRSVHGGRRVRRPTTEPSACNFPLASPGLDCIYDQYVNASSCSLKVEQRATGQSIAREGPLRTSLPRISDNPRFASWCPSLPSWGSVKPFVSGLPLAVSAVGSVSSTHFGTKMKISKTHSLTINDLPWRFWHDRPIFSAATGAARWKDTAPLRRIRRGHLLARSGTLRRECTRIHACSALFGEPRSRVMSNGALRTPNSGYSLALPIRPNPTSNSHRFLARHFIRELPLSSAGELATHDAKPACFKALSAGLCLHEACA